MLWIFIIIDSENQINYSWNQLNYSESSLHPKQSVASQLGFCFFSPVSVFHISSVARNIPFRKITCELLCQFDYFFPRRILADYQRNEIDILKIRSLHEIFHAWSFAKILWCVSSLLPSSEWWYHDIYKWLFFSEN